MDDNSQPAWKPGNALGIPKFHGGGRKAVARLDQLRFDPIGELVSKYRKLEEELERQEKIRDGVVVELLANGKPRSYRPEVHHAIYDKLISISEKLLRYRYGRVPETVEAVKKQTASLVIQLTEKGGVYQIGEVSEDPPEDGDED